MKQKGVGAFTRSLIPDPFLCSLSPSHSKTPIQKPLPAMPVRTRERERWRAVTTATVDEWQGDDWRTPQYQLQVESS